LEAGDLRLGKVTITLPDQTLISIL
jgi:hypothetical protein